MKTLSKYLVILILPAFLLTCEEEENLLLFENGTEFKSFRPEFIINGKEGDYYYTIQLASDEEFEQNVDSIVEFNLESCIWEWDLLPGEYYVRCGYGDNMTDIKKWSEAVIITLISPDIVITEPQPDTKTSVYKNIHVSWEKFEIADKYTVEAASDLNFSNIFFTKTTSSNTVNVSGFSEPGKYYIRIKALFYNDLESEWSSIETELERIDLTKYYLTERPLFAVFSLNSSGINMEAYYDERRGTHSEKVDGYLINDPGVGSILIEFDQIFMKSGDSGQFDKYNYSSSMLLSLRDMIPLTTENHYCTIHDYGSDPWNFSELQINFIKNDISAKRFDIYDSITLETASFNTSRNNQYNLFDIYAREVYEASPEEIIIAGYISAASLNNGASSNASVAFVTSLSTSKSINWSREFFDLSTEYTISYLFPIEEGYVVFGSKDDILWVQEVSESGEEKRETLIYDTDFYENRGSIIKAGDYYILTQGKYIYLLDKNYTIIMTYYFLLGTDQYQMRKLVLTYSSDTEFIITGSIEGTESTSQYANSFPAYYSFVIEGSVNNGELEFGIPTIFNSKGLEGGELDFSPEFIEGGP